VKPFFDYFSLISILLFSSLHLNAQFHLNGNATQVSDSCFQLTAANNWEVGSIWFTEKIDLNVSFEVIMTMNFGCKDAQGADGIVFGFQPVSTTIGVGGGGIGFEGVTPSIGIEFDTWQNTVYNDPASDHIAIIRNGNLNHSSASTLAGPINASPTSSNIEDCNDHELKVNWNADTKEMNIWFDCELRLSYTGDIVNEIFSGDPEVFWGFTAATGGANNRHEVCFKYTTFLDAIDDVVICPGGQFQLNIQGGLEYNWTPSTGLSNPNIPNPIAFPEETTTYFVTVLDECQTAFFDTVTVFVDGDTVFFELGVDTIFCENAEFTLDATSSGDSSVEYQWSDGSTAPTLVPTSGGNYAVTVTIDDYCVADDRIFLDFIESPKVNIGPDLALCFGESVILDIDFQFDVNYLWHDGSTSTSFFVSEPGGVYSVVASNECGIDKDEVLVTYEDCEEIYFPNVFSPNEDGFNDKFLAFDGGDVEIIIDFQVFNRWGGLVYKTSNIKPNNFDFGWDGRIDGRQANSGVYTWKADVLFRNSVREIKTGTITLVR
jgi:gliding motility-associated-like protein